MNEWLLLESLILSPIAILVPLYQRYIQLLNIRRYTHSTVHEHVEADIHNELLRNRFPKANGENESELVRDRFFVYIILLSIQSDLNP